MFGMFILGIVIGFISMVLLGIMIVTKDVGCSFSEYLEYFDAAYKVKKQKCNDPDPVVAKIEYDDGRSEELELR